MAWETDLVTMLRNVIFDVDSTDYTYSDARLKEMLVVSAQLVNAEIKLDNDYTISISTTGISPDPTTVADTDAQNFFVLKAACLADQSTLRTKALSAGNSVKLGPASISSGPSVNGYKLLIEVGPCQTYEKMKWEYELGDARAIRAVLSPFTGNTFDPRNLGGGGQGGKQGYRDNL